MYQLFLKNIIFSLSVTFVDTTQQGKKINFSKNALAIFELLFNLVDCRCGTIIQDSSAIKFPSEKQISQGPNSSPIRPQIFGGEVAKINSIPW